MFGFFKRRAKRLEAMECAIRELRASVDSTHDKMFAGNSTEESQERVRLTLRVEKLESAAWGLGQSVKTLKNEVADLRKAQASS